MKRLFFASLISSLAIACNNADEPVPDKKLIGFKNQVYWEVTDTGKLSFVRHVGGGPDTINAAGIITFLNTRWPKVQLSFVKMSDDTIYVKIPDAEYLTQQMGSSGPITYFAEAVYDFTEMLGIHRINFDFEAGDHAAPATFGRDSFKDK